MAVEGITGLVVPFVGIGLLLGCLPMLMGLGILVVIDIFKKI